MIEQEIRLNLDTRRDNRSFLDRNKLINLVSSFIKTYKGQPSFMWTHIQHVDKNTNLIKRVFNLGPKGSQTIMYKKQTLFKSYKTLDVLNHGKVSFNYSNNTETTIPEFPGVNTYTRAKSLVSFDNVVPGWTVFISFVVADETEKLGMEETLKFRSLDLKKIQQPSYIGWWQTIEIELEKKGFELPRDEKLATPCVNAAVRFFMKKLLEGLNPVELYFGKLNRPRNFGVEHVEVTRDYFVTPKVDGRHSVLIINKKGAKLYNTDGTLVKPLKMSHNVQIVMEGEFLDGSFYPFDIIQYGSPVIDKPFTERLKLMHSVLGKTIVHKPFVKVDKIGTLQHQEYPTDGIVFISPYDSYRQTNIYKWKPANQHSIDFLLWKAPPEFDKKDGKIPYVIYNGAPAHWKTPPGLPCPPKHGNLKPVPFIPRWRPKSFLYYGDDEQLHGKVCELVYANGKWKLLRIREDKTSEYLKGETVGNFISVAEDVWNSIRAPATMDMIIKGEIPGYFKKRDRSFDRVRNFNNGVKHKILNQFIKPGTAVLDLACGKGQDIFKYNRLGVKRYVGIDSDVYALKELLRRAKKLDSFIRVADVDLTNHTPDIVADLEASGIPIVDKFDTVVINMAIHYFASSKSKMGNLIELVSSALKPNGQLIVTSFDGDRVHKLISDKNWDKPPFYISKQYPDNKGKTFGLKIGVKMPFSDKPYIEHLVFLRSLKSVCRAFDLNLSHQDFFNNLSDTSDLTEDELTYVSLYSSVVFQRGFHDK